MDFQLSDDQKAFVEAAKQFSDNQLKPKAAEWDRQHIFPKDVLESAGKLGFMGLYSPEAVGGMELARLDAALIFEQLSKGCTSTTAYMTIHNMVTWMIGTYGTDEVKKSVCPDMIAGHALGSYCLTEPQAGSDAAALSSKAERVGENYLITGSKCFISGAGDSDVLVVMAKTQKDEISAFVVPANSEGIRYGRREPKLGWNSQATRTISFDKVTVPLSHRLGLAGDGFKMAMRALDGGRINIASCSLGTAQQALEDALVYTKERKQFGRRLTEFQALQFRLADMATELTAARQLLYFAASQLDNGHPDATTYCAMAKRYVTDVSFRVCDQALQMFGGYGYIQEYPMERYFRDVRVHQILEGTNEIMRLIIARRLLKEQSYLWSAS